MYRLSAIGLVALCLTAALGGCATTQPWEREVLARPEMAPDPCPRRQSLRSHYLAVREGAVGGISGGGGGCGCN